MAEVIYKKMKIKGSPIIVDAAIRDDKGRKISDKIDELSGKQDKLVAGDNITIDPDTNVISASGGSGGDDNYIEINYADLVELRDTSQLRPGAFYRITDYETTTVQEDTRSAGHLFDIIVQALDEKTISENAFACLHEGDTYFADSKLEAWKLKYCLDNDTNRFVWADEVNGKGVIYRMIDEFNNDVPYDFKNIQFKRKLTDGVYDEDAGTETWCYTFTMSDMVNVRLVDFSLKQNTEYTDSEGQYRECTNNSIKEAVLDYMSDGLIRIQLNNNVFLNIFDGDVNYIYYGCRSNTFGYNCFNNTFGNSCESNTFGYNCFNNTFGAECYANTFGSFCTSNTFGIGFFENTIGNSFRDNTFGDECGANIFGNNCFNNTFGNNCSANIFGNSYGANTFGNSCESNTFGNSCLSNTFADNCIYNTFGNSCESNTFGNSCDYNALGSRCRYLKISDNTSNQKKYISVDSGVQGASSANQLDLYDSAILNKDYQFTFKKSASGKYLMLWATDTGTMTGKVKATNTTADWADI